MISARRSSPRVSSDAHGVQGKSNRNAPSSSAPTRRRIVKPKRPTIRSPRALLVAFYQLYNPSKLSQVDAILTKYGHRTDTLFRALFQKYNVHPSFFVRPLEQLLPISTLPTTTSTTILVPGPSPRDMLVEFYQQHNPAKVAEVDQLLDKYSHCLDVMFRRLAAKYNADPSIFFGPNDDDGSEVPSSLDPAMTTLECPTSLVQDGCFSSSTRKRAHENDIVMQAFSATENQPDTKTAKRRKTAHWDPSTAPLLHKKAAKRKSISKRFKAKNKKILRRVKKKEQRN